VASLVVVFLQCFQAPVEEGAIVLLLSPCCGSTFCLGCLRVLPTLAVTPSSVLVFLVLEEKEPWQEQEQKGGEEGVREQKMWCLWVEVGDLWEAV
jgi:hypothetical protein